MTKHVFVKEQAICETTFFVESVDETTRSAYRDINCAACLRQSLAAAGQRTQVLHELLAIAPREEAAGRTQALCHECLEMVDVVAGKLSPHHGTFGDGCSMNDAVAQIYLHPRAADRIAQLEAALVFDAPGGAR